VEFRQHPCERGDIDYSLMFRGISRRYEFALASPRGYADFLFSYIDAFRTLLQRGNDARDTALSIAMLGQLLA
jgi:hypothetical protein